LLKLPLPGAASGLGGLCRLSSTSAYEPLLSTQNEFLLWYRRVSERPASAPAAADTASWRPSSRLRSRSAGSVKYSPARANHSPIWFCTA